MNRDLVRSVKQKKEFSALPDSVAVAALEKNENDVKLARAFLRKYFGVFLTNKVLKPKDLSNRETVLRSHISSKKRDYSTLYGKIFREQNNFKSVIDFGCGVNGFSVSDILKFAKIEEYFGVEASGQIVKNTNDFFSKNFCGENFKVLWLDLFDLQKVKEIVRGAKEPRAIFCFQVTDALESFKKDFSKEFIFEVIKEMGFDDIFILSFPKRSLSGRKSFEASRKWLLDFLEENFSIKEDFELFDEKFIVFAKRGI